MTDIWAGEPSPEDVVRHFIGEWVELERRLYADKKYADGESNREELVQAMREQDWARWTNFAGNYLKRAELFGFDTLQGRQALGKAIVALLHTLETACDLFGDMPQPGVPSGEIRQWAGKTL